MPPMAAGGMQRGMYGRAESPYNAKYLTAAFSSGSSNGAATSTASSMAVFGLGSETVSSGRSPASNNALVAYTPSRGVLSCRGLWPLYVTCDVPVPYARSMADMLALLHVIATPDEEVKGDFYREQTHAVLPKSEQTNYSKLAQADALRGKRIGVPKLYVGENDSDPHAKPVTVNPETISLWKRAAADLESLGAEIVYTDFPLVTNYENDSKSSEPNNVVDAPSGWNLVERSTLIAKAWSDFLTQNNDPKIKSLADVDPLLLFPKPQNYLPDTWLEVRNWINYAGLPELEAKLKDTLINDFPGLKEVLPALEAQRKRDLEDWMDALKLDCVAFPAQGDVGIADLEFNLESARYSLQNGIKYSNGNRAIRHLGVPTVSVPMGIRDDIKMPVNLTFAGKAYDDEKLLAYAYAYEQKSKARIMPALTPALETDVLKRAEGSKGMQNRIELTASLEIGYQDNGLSIRVQGNIHSEQPMDRATVEIWLDGSRAAGQAIDNGNWRFELDHKPERPEVLGWDLQPLRPRPVMVIVVARAYGALTAAVLLWAQ